MVFKTISTTVSPAARVAVHVTPPNLTFNLTLTVTTKFGVVRQIRSYPKIRAANWSSSSFGGGFQGTLGQICFCHNAFIFRPN